MRFVLNGRFLNRPVTGVERLALELSRSVRELLAQRGCADLEVVLPRGTRVSENIGRLGDPQPPIHAMGRLHGHAWEQLELTRALPDAWLLNLCNTGPVTRRRQALLICDAQVMLHPASYSRAFRLWYRLMMTLASRRAAVVFTISEFSKTQLEQFGLVPRGKAQVLRLGVDHLDQVVPDRSVLVRHGLERRPYLLAIGSLAPHKNLAMLIDAFADASLPGVDLVIAGGGNPRIFQSAGLREAPNIHYIGRVTDEELRALYGGALAFACPSLSEGFGFTPLEAMSMGCPIVATTGGAVPEVCGDAALYADPLDPIGWREALRTIVNGAALRADLAARAKSRAALFAWRNTACQLLAALAKHDDNAALLSALDQADDPMGQGAPRQVESSGRPGFHAQVC